jgi:hypothetical protein
LFFCATFGCRHDGASERVHHQSEQTREIGGAGACQLHVRWLRNLRARARGKSPDWLANRISYHRFILEDDGARG